jgi:hypothetical protein
MVKNKKTRLDLIYENKDLIDCLNNIKKDLALSEMVKPCFEFLKSSIKANTIILDNGTNYKR